MKKIHKSEKSFLDLYVEEIEPVIKNLDVILKSGCEITPGEFAEIIGPKKEDIAKILDNTAHTSIGKQNIIEVISKTDNEICAMIKREIECGSPDMYSSREISYIYKIEKSKVDAAFSFIDCERIPGEDLPAVFAQIIL